MTQTKIGNITLLQSTPFFSELSDEDTKWFLDKARFAEYPKKSFLFQRGDSADFILKLSMDRGYAKTVKLPYNKLLVASRLCMQPETFSRSIKRLEEDTGTTIKGRDITIGDTEELQDYCEVYCCKDKECSLQEKLTCSSPHCDMFRFLKLM